MSKTVPITGVSGGLGRAFAEEALAAGHRVVGTVRKPDQIGSFSIDWAGRSMVRVPCSILDYEAVFDPIHAARKAKDGNRTGVPVRAAKALLTVLDADDPPVHLALGSDALRLVQQGRQRLQDDIDNWAHLTASTDFPTDH
ncbi:hypothetical protein ACFWMG_47250 [Streptomyces sp. NPDC127074]|uniref:hypothetical protein n=1 Tax=Streptomyces sp. NPDC127074 TaxID=3347130 RepID=UPI00364F3F7B